MTFDDASMAALGDRATVRRALRAWQQKVQAVIDIARDDDDLAARLPVLDRLATELVDALARASDALQRLGVRLPPGADVLRRAVGEAHAVLAGIELWHRPPSVEALRKARDHFRLAADRLAAE
jgi:hypothetical protein